MDNATTQQMISPSEIMEYLYCPRFTYFLNVLKISQNEDRRFKVLKGREIHEQRQKRNAHQVRRDIPMVRKETNVYLASQTLKVRGIVDEVIFMKDGSIAPLDYKFSTFNGRVYSTYSVQLTLYALMIEEQYNTIVTHGYLAYVRRRRAHIQQVEITETLRQKTQRSILNTFRIIQQEYFPSGTPSRTKCGDCTYRNICIQ